MENVSPETFFKPSGGAVVRCVESPKYAKNFGDQWHRFPRTQLDSFSKLNLSKERLKRCLGDSLWADLSRFTVLEVGAGAGRFTEVLLREGAQVLSVDLSSAVDVNASNFPPGPRHAVVQADVMDLPFRAASFDLVLCLGVIQHTPNSEATIAKLSAQVRPGGWLVLDHYRFSLSYVSLRIVYRAILKRMPARFSHRLIETLAAVFLPLHKISRNHKWLSRILNRFSPMITYYSAFPDLDADAQKEWALLDTVDALTDRYKRFRSTAQIQACLESLGFTEIWVANGGNGVEARARRL